MEDRYAAVQRLARAERDRIRDAFASEIRAEHKSARDLVTALDQDIERTLVDAIRDAYPDDAICGEEHGARSGSSGFEWVIDPIDGTGNFVHGIPLFSVSIACLRDGVPLFGIVYDPIADSCYAASEAAVLDGEPIAPSERTLKDAFVTFCHSTSTEGIRAISTIYEQMKLDTYDFRKLGSANLEICMVASGKVSAFVGYEIKPWDFIPGCIIAERAGCAVTGFSGEDWRDPDVRSVLVAEPGLHEELLARVEGLTSRT
ncbi:MAG: inositol monophosphatase family protein [Candidatus Woesearchaeota archaeon]